MGLAGVSLKVRLWTQYLKLSGCGRAPSCRHGPPKGQPGLMSTPVSRGTIGSKLGPDVTLVPTGIACEAPLGYDVQIRPRSGLARRGVNVILGTLDSDYRGELFVSMHTFGSTVSYQIETGDRVAQLVISRFEALELVEVDELADSGRGSAGHGSTGR